jgi:hypothetical protein
MTNTASHSFPLALWTVLDECVVLFLGPACGEVLGALWWFEGNGGQNAPVRVPAGNDLQLVEVRKPRLDAIIALAQDVVVQDAHPRDVGGHLVTA